MSYYLDTYPLVKLVALEVDGAPTRGRRVRPRRPRRPGQSRDGVLVGRLRPVQRPVGSGLPQFTPGAPVSLVLRLDTRSRSETSHIVVRSPLKDGVHVPRHGLRARPVLSVVG